MVTRIRFIRNFVCSLLCHLVLIGSFLWNFFVYSLGFHMAWFLTSFKLNQSNSGWRDKAECFFGKIPQPYLMWGANIFQTCIEVSFGLSVILLIFSLYLLPTFFTKKLLNSQWFFDVSVSSWKMRKRWRHQICVISELFSFLAKFTSPDVINVQKWFKKQKTRHCCSWALQWGSFSYLLRTIEHSM